LRSAAVAVKTGGSSRTLRTFRRGAALLGALAGALVLTACEGLPVVRPGLLASSVKPATLVGARGVLSPAQSRAIIERVSAGVEESDIVSRHLAVEAEVTGTPLTAGNEVRLLQDGPATYDAMFAAIEAAQDHINLETYIFDDGDIGQRFAAALIAKQAQGVQVNVMRDSAGTLGTPPAFFAKLQAAGVAVLEFNPLNPLKPQPERTGWSPNQRDHRKLLIVDGRVAFLGGINISSVYSTGSSAGNAFRRAAGAGSARSRARGQGASTGWRDTDVQLRGPVVADFQRLFLAAWEAQQGPPLAQRNYFPPAEVAGKQVVRAIGSSPADEYSQIYVTLLSAIGSAETSIRLTNAYFAPDPQLLEALEAAAARGVDVTLILPSRSDSALVFNAGRTHYDRLLAAGVKIAERRGPVLHAKTALIDGVWASVGSANLDWRSFLHNHELNAVVLGVDFGQQMEAAFAGDLKESDPVNLAQWRQRPWVQRLKEWFAQLFDWWL